MHFSTLLVAALYAANTLAAPVLVARQGAGVGQGCNAILSDTDTSSGQIVKQGGAYLAKTLSKGGLKPRQGAGVGAGCDAIFSDTDTSSGQIVKQGGAAIAKKIKGGKRQLDKMGAGAGYVLGALPGGQSADQEVTDSTGTIDGNGTNGSAMLGEAVGQAELDIGNGVTETAFGTTSNGGGTTARKERRQLDKAGAGVGYVVGALPGGKNAGDKITSETGTIDGNTTNGSAKLGEAVGQAELNTGDAITETAFGTTTNGGGGGSGSAPPPAPAKKGGAPPPAKKGGKP